MKEKMRIYEQGLFFGRRIIHDWRRMDRLLETDKRMDFY
jgi:hypothetical protein